MYNFLAPLYSSAAADGNGSNDGDYKNEEFDALIAEGLAAADEDASIEKYKAAQAILMEDLPAIPLWYQNGFGGYSTLVATSSSAGTRSRCTSRSPSLIRPPAGGGVLRRLPPVLVLSHHYRR